MMRATAASLLGSLIGLALPWAASPAHAAKPTKAQELRAMMAPADIKELQGELAKMRSQYRWPQAQQDRYLVICLKAKRDEPSINRRVCECYLEVMMEKHATMGDFSKDLINNGVQKDEKVAGLTGMCIAAFGD